jgi:hypothetical protein
MSKFIVFGSAMCLGLVYVALRQPQYAWRLRFAIYGDQAIKEG